MKFALCLLIVIPTGIYCSQLTPTNVGNTEIQLGCQDKNSNCQKEFHRADNYCLNDGVLEKCQRTCHQCTDKCGDNWTNCKAYKTSCAPGSSPPPFKNGRTIMRDHCKCTCGQCKKGGHGIHGTYTPGAGSSGGSSGGIHGAYNPSGFGGSSGGIHGAYNPSGFGGSHNTDQNGGIHGTYNPSGFGGSGSHNNGSSGGIHGPYKPVIGSHNKT